jgi:hypothetical protein
MHLLQVIENQDCDRYADENKRNRRQAHVQDRVGIGRKQ